MNQGMIPFNKPYFSGNETVYIEESIRSGKISGDGIFTKRCHEFFEKNLNFRKVLLTTSCTDALEMSALLLNISPGDEIIVPAYTFVSTVNAFVLRGAKIVFADSTAENPNIDVSQLESLITERTKAIVPVHYAGIACDMDAICSIAKKYNVSIVEDAAQAIDSYYKGRQLGSIGQLAAFSFHETKNIISGEGGMLAINDEKFVARAEVIREKGTNRSSFFRGEVDKYGWVDIGSSFLPSDIIAAFLLAQLENINDIQAKRISIWNTYYAELAFLKKGGVGLPVLPDYATNNGHMFYMVCRSLEERTALINFLKQRSIMSVFHYISLHKSPFFAGEYEGRELTYSDYYTDHLLRLPLYYELSNNQQMYVIDSIKEFYLNFK